MPEALEFLENTNSKLAWLSWAHSIAMNRLKDRPDLAIRLKTRLHAVKSQVLRVYLVFCPQKRADIKPMLDIPNVFILRLAILQAGIEGPVFENAKQCVLEAQCALKILEQENLVVRNLDDIGSW